MTRSHISVYRGKLLHQRQPLTAADNQHSLVGHCIQHQAEVTAFHGQLSASQLQHAYAAI